MDSTTSQQAALAQTFNHSAAPSPAASAPIPPVRRQNIACDACRSRKIRCNRQAASSKCDNCTAKQLECTAHFLASLKPKRRRESSANGNGSGAGHSRESPSEDESGGDATRRTSAGDKRRKSIEASSSSHSNTAVPASDLSRHVPIPEESPTAGPSQHSPSSRAYEQMLNLIRYLFSPIPVHYADFGYDDRMIHSCASCLTWEGPASTAHLRMTVHDEMMSVAVDCVQTYFQIVHIRLPVLDPTAFKARFSEAESHDNGPPPHVLLAIVIAFGCRFSRHEAVEADREECSAAMQRELRPGQKQGVRRRCRMAQMVAIRAREVAEVNKAFRLPSLENIQAALLLDALLGENISSPQTYRASWFRTAIDHLNTLGFNKKAIIVGVEDKQLRGCLVFAWWLASFGEAYSSCFYRLKPLLNDNDYDVEQPTPPESNALPGQNVTPQPLGTLCEYMVWYSANQQIAKICRAMCAELWIPRVEANGIPVTSLMKLVQLITRWRDDHLATVGVPKTWPKTWDFVAAVTSCGIDSNYHVMWVVLQHAIRDFGIRAEDRVVAQSVVEQISQEAVHGALRVAALTSVLTANDYLKLDPNLLYFAVHESAIHLSSLGLDEAMSCIAGLRQYGVLYEAAYDHADACEARLLAQQARNNADMFGPAPAPIFPLPQDRLVQSRDPRGMPSSSSIQQEPFNGSPFNGLSLSTNDVSQAQISGFDAFSTLSQSQGALNGVLDGLARR